MSRHYREIECGGRGNACFPLSVANGTGRDPQEYSDALDRLPGETVDIADLSACQHGVLNVSDTRRRRMDVFCDILRGDDVRLRIYALGVGDNSPRRLMDGTVEIPVDDPAVDINPVGRQDVRLLFASGHYRRLISVDHESPRPSMMHHTPASSSMINRSSSHDHLIQDSLRLLGEMDERNRRLYGNSDNTMAPMSSLHDSRDVLSAAIRCVSRSNQLH